MRTLRRGRARGRVRRRRDGALATMGAEEDGGLVFLKGRARNFLDDR